MNTKKLLNEWKNYLNSLNNPKLLNEISFEALNAQFPSFDFSSIEREIKNDNDNTRRNLFRKFKKNTVYLDIVANTLKTKRSHSPGEFFDQFDLFLKVVMTTKERWPESFDDLFIYKSGNITGSTATYEDIQQYLDVRSSQGRGNIENLNKSLQDTIDGRNILHYEIVYEDSNWIICYISSQLASLAIARSFWNGSNLEYDTTFDSSTGTGQKIGDMKWCTAVSGDGNMFNRYHIQKNLHMYYCINKINQDINNEERKLCISFYKENNQISLSETDNATVDAFNGELDEGEIKDIIGVVAFEKLIDDVKKDTRKQQSEVQYYENITLKQYIELRKQNDKNIEDFASVDISKILRFSREKKEIAEYIFKTEKDVNVLKTIIYNIRVTLDVYLEIKSRLKKDKFGYIVSTLLHRAQEKENIINYILENEKDESIIQKALENKEFTFEEFRNFNFNDEERLHSIFQQIIHNADEDEAQKIIRFVYKDATKYEIKWICLKYIKPSSSDEFYEIYNELKKSDTRLLTECIGSLINHTSDGEDILIDLLRSENFSIDFIVKSHILKRRASPKLTKILLDEFREILTTEYIETKGPWEYERDILLEFLNYNKYSIKKYIMDEFSDDEKITSKVIYSLDNSSGGLNTSDEFFYFANKLNDKQLNDSKIDRILARKIVESDEADEIIQEIENNIDNRYMKCIAIHAFCRTGSSFEKLKSIHDRFGTIPLNGNAAYQMAYATNDKKTYYYISDHIEDNQEEKDKFYKELIGIASDGVRGYIVKLTFDDLMYFGKKHRFDVFAKHLYMVLSQQDHKVFDKKTKKLIAKFILDNESMFEQKDEIEKTIYNVIDAAKEHLGIQKQELNVESLLKTYIKLIIS